MAAPLLDFPMPDTSELKSSNLPIIWVLGGPGSGKGTQCDRMVAKYGFTHISTGDLLRAEVASGSERGKALEEIMREGKLVPNDVVLSLLGEKMLGSLSTSTGYLIDGYPREKNQGVDFEEKVGHCSVAIFFEANDAVLTGRLLERAKSSGRQDDNAETIQKRIDTFHEHNDPILQHFRDKMKIINSEGEMDEIFGLVVKEINSVLPR